MQTRIGDQSAADRNKTPIYESLAPRLVRKARVLEIGAGHGVHAGYFTARRPDLLWQASEAPAGLAALRTALAEFSDLPAPIALDVREQQGWPAGRFDVVYGANVAHIMSVLAVEALIAGAAAHLVPGGLFCLYGPFFEHDIAWPGAGNIAFDRALSIRDPAMGLRERADLDALAEAAGLTCIARESMPSDNRLLIWQRASVASG